MKDKMRAKKPVKKLTLKQKKFTAEFIKTGNGTKSAIKAGYSPKSARVIAQETLLNPAIQEKIQSAAEKLGITPEYVLGNLKEIADFNKKPHTKYDAQGNKIEEMVDSTATIKANELLGKHLSLFIDKSEVDIKVEETLESKSKLELAKQIALALKNPEILNQ